MRWVHEDAPGRSVRLAYCMNVHAAEDLSSIERGMRAVTLPLRDRLADGRPFGIGMYLAGELAQHLARPGGAADLDQLDAFLRAESLDPFTFNAFPYGGFNAGPLKHDVYRPTWMEDERVAFTSAVAHCAAALARATDEIPLSARHISISTHAGAFGTWIKGAGDLTGCAANMARAVEHFARIEADGGPQLVLSVEAEPRSSANDSAKLFAYLSFARAELARILAGPDLDRTDAAHLAARHLGTCLDCCHSAVEYEDPERALSLATAGGPLGKLQFSSALHLEAPAANPAAQAQLLAMDEERYLHQVTARATAEPDAQLLACDDLPDLAAALDSPSAPDWTTSPSWRCHFHVPVDREQIGAGLTTTRAHADHLLDLCLASPTDWTTDELHVEIETYTWDVLPAPARGPGDLIDGLEREYRHVITRLQSAGWKRPPVS
ncbi:MAG: hypothetical protein ACI8QZ_002622 [Chlamydiales bacterium]|jgi:hypothetical protein